MYIKKSWMGLKVEVFASAAEQDIIANELCFMRKPVYRGAEAEDILDYLEEKQVKQEAYKTDFDEFEVMRSVPKKETKKSLGRKPQTTTKKKVSTNKTNTRKK